MNKTAIKGARVFTAVGDDAGYQDDVTIVIEDGKIAAVGRGAAIPEGATVIDAAGKVVTPGLIDAHCHIGISEDSPGPAGEDSNEATDPITPEMRALDAINPKDIAYQDAIAAGVTCVQVDPGSANIIGGEALVMKTWGAVVDDLVIKRPSGMKAALGENPKMTYGRDRKLPSTRMGNAAALRKALTAAKDYRRKREAAKTPDKLPDVNMKHEALIPVLSGEVPLRIHCHRADDIVTAIRIAQEFGLAATLEHCTEGDKVLDVVKSSGFRVTMGPSLTDRSKLECRDIGFAAPVALSKAGVKLAIITDHPVFPIQYLRICAGLAVREGMAESAALLGITRYAAEIAGVADRVGSIETGKDADLVIWSKDPLEYDSVALTTFIDGGIVNEYPRRAGDIQ